MPSKGPNEPGYANRLTFVEDLFNNILKLVPLKIEVIAYDGEFPFPYNNFVFVVEIEPHITAESRQGRLPGTVQIPFGHKKFVLRLPNLEASYNQKVRVENEVAALMLAREALNDFIPAIVPRLFAWGSATGGNQGWMLQELMPGNSLTNEFPQMKLSDQRRILEQMANILMKLQQYKLPSSIQGSGGIAFNEAGQVVIGPLSTMDCGPFEAYEDFVLGIIRSKLAKANKNKVVVGWTENDMDIRARLDRFLATGFQVMMKEVHERDRTLVHADLSTDNLLYDPSTMQLTAVFDFDFGHIGTVADNFFRSLGHGIGRFPDPREGEEMLALNRAMLDEFPHPLPDSNEDIQWPQAKMWDDALRA